MRTLEWGKFTAEAADFTHHKITGNSVVCDGSGSNADGSPLDVALIGMRVNGPERTKCLLKIALSTIRSLIGASPTIVRAQLVLWQKTIWNWPVAGRNIGFYRLISTVDYTDATARYRDATGPVTWYGDAYGPYAGKDTIATPFSSLLIPNRTSGDLGSYTDYYDVTNELRERLRQNRDIEAVFRCTGEPLGTSELGYVDYYKSTAGKMPYLSILYLLPIEFFPAVPGGTTIDLSRPLDNILDVALDLGAYERGETGTAVKLFAKNFSGRALPHLEIWDDYPEWTVPVQTVGTTGTFSYVEPLSDALSQAYEIEFTSATAYKIKATAYRDNVTALNPVAGGTGWTGDTSTLFTAPSGGLTIPAAAWGGTTPVTGDKWVVYVVGNTTNAAWPSDSNAMVQIANDDGTGTGPDAATWRPVTGQRSVLAAGVTIDATSKQIEVLHIATALWIPGDPIFVADSAAIDEGVIASVDDDTHVTITFPSATSSVYAAGAKVGTTLPIRNTAAGAYGITTAAAGAVETPANFIPLTNADDIFTSGSVYIQDVDDPSGTTEEATIQTVSSSGITLTADLTGNYAAGSLVTLLGSGEAPFWLRVVVTAGSAQEYKQLRLNARV